MKKNNLDERQEQVLLKIEHNGCWLAFWGLLAALVVEFFFLNFDAKAVAGEWIVFMVLALYMVFACIRNGIWDRRLMPNFKTNLIVSAIASIAFGILMTVGVSLRAPGKLAGSLAAGFVSAIPVFVLCLVFLSISAKRVKKIVEAQEAGTEEQDESYET